MKTFTDCFLFHLPFHEEKTLGSKELRGPLLSPLISKCVLILSL